MAKTIARGRLPFLLAGILVGALAMSVVSPATATHQPANKAAVAGSTLRVMEKNVTPGTDQSTIHDLLGARMRVSTPADLLVQVSAECALWTNTAVIGNEETGRDDQESKARVEVWIEVDGTVIPVSADDTSDAEPSFDPDDQGSEGRVVFCNRAQRMLIEGFDDLGSSGGDEDEQNEGDTDNLIALYNRSRSANGFNWVIPNASQYDDPSNGKNILDIIVKARLAAQIICDGEPGTTDCASPATLAEPENPAALAAVGKRTLVIEPLKLANDIQTVS